MSKQYPKISELSETLRAHMAWRLDHNTACGYLTACGICSLRYEAWKNMPINQIFEKAGDVSPHKAKILSTKVLKFKIGSDANK